jgi:hypothetical protein
MVKLMLSDERGHAGGAAVLGSDPMRMVYGWLIRDMKVIQLIEVCK